MTNRGWFCIIHNERSRTMKTWKKRMLSFSATVLALLLVSGINEKDYAGILMERGYSEELVKRMSEKDIAY